MERESFEDEEVAKILNDSFISIKVDKEERPDVDTIYMTVCQSVNGHGGWPLTILMTPEQKPFFAGTYLPKKSTERMFGLVQLLTSVATMWKADKQRLYDSSDDITTAIRQAEERIDENVTLNKTIFGRAFVDFQRSFDSKFGGFGEAPKFPSPHNLLFLLRYAKLYQNQDALNMVEKTLNSMYQGGMYDHIGGGFSRYSTDERWLVPHFEKMLYDNALLVMAYAEAFQITKKPIYEKVIRETLQYIMAEMTDETGGFYCAQDADSEGEEGKYYVFTPDEVTDVLGKEDGTWFCEQYKITKQGNFEGASIPNRIGSTMFTEMEEKRANSCKQKLYEYRKGRVALHKDDKILTSWNSLMIVAFAKAYQVLGEECYLEAARKAYEFIGQNLKDEDNRLAVRYRDGHRFGLGNLEDYAFYVWAQIALYEATFEPMYLCEAVKDMDECIHLFWDQEQGGFYYYGEDAENLILRPKEVYDGAIPSGNSVAAYILARLEKLTRKDEYWKIADQQMNFLGSKISDYPSAYAFALCALMEKLIEGKEIVCLLKDRLDWKDLMQLLRNYYLPNAVVIAVEEHTKDGLALVAEYINDYKNVVTESEIYICESFNCLPPLKGMEQLKAYLIENDWPRK